MIKKIFILLPLFVSAISFSFAQELDLKVISSAGKNIADLSNLANLSFTVGETAIQSHNQSGAAFGQGFHNTGLITVGLRELDLASIKLKVFPNPVVDRLFLHFDNKVEAIHYQVSVWNLLGQPINAAIGINGYGTHIINTLDWPTGVYILQLADQFARTVNLQVVKID